MTNSRISLGAVSSGVAALLAAVPTLVFPADSPTEPKLALLATGAVFFAIAVVQLRRESGSAPRWGEDLSAK